MSAGVRTGYILGEYSKDSSSGCVITLCCRNDHEYFEIDCPHSGLYFFVEEEAGLSLPFEVRRSRAGMKNPRKRGLDRIEFKHISDFFEAKKQLKTSGITLYESDIHPDDKFLEDRGLFRAVTAAGEWETRGGIRYSASPELTPADLHPGFRILSLDIETGTDGTVYCIGIHAGDALADFKAVLMRDEDASLSKRRIEFERESPDGNSETAYLLYPYTDEKQLLEGFFSILGRIDPDIIIGWNVINFDLLFIQNRCAALSIPFTLGRGGRPGRIIQKRTGMSIVETPGRIVIDGPQSLRTGFHAFDDYRLDSVAKELLGVGKDISEGGGDKVQEIEQRFLYEKEALARYNIIDAILVSEIFEKTGLISQFTTRSLLTGLRMDKVNMSVAAFDFFMVPRLHTQGYAAIDTEDVVPGGHAAGGFVFTSDPGLYDDVAVFDFMSLYPSIMRTFKIDPLSRLENTVDPVMTPVDIAFSKTRHILPEHIAYLLETRNKAKKEGDVHLSQAVKILMNSYYGVMGTTGCRFYHPDLPTAITGTGQWVLKETASFFRRSGLEVLYGDTDSVFVRIGESEPLSFNRRASALVEEANAYFTGLLMDRFGIESYLVLEYEKHYSKFFLTPMRGSQEGSRKRYAGLDAATGEIEYKGLETVRSDWTDAAKQFQQELYRRFFHGEEVAKWIKDYAAELQEGLYDAGLVYRKRLTKSALEYTKNIPPHVKAALLLDPEGKKRIRRVSYLMTVDGPVPVGHDPARIDYGHYIEKQIKPIADTVLQFLNTDFDSILTGHQLDLFG